MSDKMKILFLCTGNSCRSQMAEGWARHLKSDALEVRSAGIETHGLNPRAVQVMASDAVCPGPCNAMLRHHDQNASPARATSALQAIPHVDNPRADRANLLSSELPPCLIAACSEVSSLLR